jgi:hypothetical protein
MMKVYPRLRISQNYAKNAEFIIPEEAEFLKNLNASLAVVNLKKAGETIGNL